MHNNPLLARFTPSRPALLTPGHESWFRSCLQQAAADPRLPELLAEAQSARGLMIAASNDDGFWYAADDWRASYRPYVVKDGILQIPVKGVLLHDFPFAFGSWATGYAYIWRAFERGMNDIGVRAIALMCDSPGGMVAGCFELVDKMKAMRATKPVRAFAHESAYSAAYAIASAASHIAVSRTGGVGSIGVVTYHTDASKALDEAGLKITFIFAGKHKVDGNITEPLPADVKARIQAHVNDIYGIFVSTVARNRAIDEKAVRDTEALCFSAPEAIANKLADSIGSLDDAVAAFEADLSQIEREGDTDMANDKTHTQADVDAAHTAGVNEGREAATKELTSAHAAALSVATTDGAKAERARIQAIVNHDEAKDREKMAKHLAFATSMSADEAVALLKESPKVEAKNERPRDRLDEALAGGNPGVGADADDAGKDLKGYERGMAIADAALGKTTKKAA